MDHPGDLEVRGAGHHRPGVSENLSLPHHRLEVTQFGEVLPDKLLVPPDALVGLPGGIDAWSAGACGF
ncbi:hypothetical protein ACWD4L_27210 [Streptomyces sp. NPDC002596]